MYSHTLRPGERVKKCASCSKDLPEAALHCVFCGAKQAAAPAVQSSVAKTAFGYSANEVMAQLGTQQQPPAAPAPQPYQPPRAHPASQPPPQAQPYQPPRPHPGSQPPPVGYGQGGLAPTAAAQAPTMFVQNGPGQGMTGPMPGNPAYTPPVPAPQPQPGAPAYGAYGAGTGPMSGGMSPPLQAPAPIGGMGIHSPPQPTPAPLPTAQPPPYLASQTAARAGRPIEPWKDSLRLMMFIFGAVALAAFAAPLVTEPMTFQWDAIIHGAGTEKVPGLIWAAAALLSIVVGAIPMATFPRGLLAMVLGLAGVFVPIGIMGGFSDWKTLLTLVSLVCMIPGLFARHEYTESIVPRVLVTIGVVLTLVQYLIPDHGQIPLVMLVKALIEAGSHMELVIIPLAQIVLAVLCLLVWMPGPATAGAKIFAWAWILFPVAVITLDLLGGRGSPIDHLTKTPGMVLGAFVPSMLYTVLVGYGGATVVGKQLE